MPANALFTIGYGSRSLDDFIGLLNQHCIEYLIDVRSHPHSRYKREFNREILAKAIEDAELRYVFMGDALGGRPADQTCYPAGLAEGRPDYELVRTRPWFLAGIERLETGLQQGCRMAIMCAEQKPEVCHRTRLVSQHLHQRGVNIMHIDESGQLQPHDIIMQRIRDDQPSLF